MSSLVNNNSINRYADNSNRYIQQALTESLSEALSPALAFAPTAAFLSRINQIVQKNNNRIYASEQTTLVGQPMQQAVPKQPSLSPQTQQAVDNFEAEIVGMSLEQVKDRVRREHQGFPGQPSDSKERRICGYKFDEIAVIAV